MPNSINDNLKLNAARSLDAKAGKIQSGVTVPYTDLSEVNAAIDPAYRYLGLSVLVNLGDGLTEYWYKDDIADESLVKKSVDWSINR